MGRGKHCTPSTRNLILKLLSEGKSYKFIQNVVGCSPTVIANCKKCKPKQESRGAKSKILP